MALRGKTRRLFVYSPCRPTARSGTDHRSRPHQRSTVDGRQAFHWPRNYKQPYPPYFMVLNLSPESHAHHTMFRPSGKGREGVGSQVALMAVWLGDDVIYGAIVRPAHSVRIGRRNFFARPQSARNHPAKFNGVRVSNNYDAQLERGRRRHRECRRPGQRALSPIHSLLFLRPRVELSRIRRKADWDYERLRLIVH